MAPLLFFGVISSDPIDNIVISGTYIPGLAQQGGGIFYGNPLVAAGSVSGDPHFTGLHGEKYDVTGKPNTWFNIISSPSFQYNAYFEAACADKPWMTAISAIALKINTHTVFINTTGSALVDGKIIPIAPWNQATSFGADGSLAHPWENFFHIETPVVSLTFERHMIDPTIQKPGMVYYGQDCLVGYFNTAFKDVNTSVPMHGLLGQTSHHNHKSPVVTIGKEGEGEIEGTFKDYIVSGPFASDFKYNLFSP